MALLWQGYPGLQGEKGERGDRGEKVRETNILFSIITVCMWVILYVWYIVIKSNLKSGVCCSSTIWQSKQFLMSPCRVREAQWGRKVWKDRRESRDLQGLISLVLWYVIKPCVCCLEKNKYALFCPFYAREWQIQICVNEFTTARIWHEWVLLTGHQWGLRTWWGGKGSIRCPLPFGTVFLILCLCSHHLMFHPGAVGPPVHNHEIWFRWLGIDQSFFCYFCTSYLIVSQFAKQSFAPYTE